MKASRCVVLFCLIGFLSAGMSWQDTEEKPLPDDIVLLEYRALFPGEAVKISINSLPIIKSVQVLFRGKTYEAPQKSDVFLCLIGLDLGMKEGIYPVTVRLHKEDRTVDEIKKEIYVKTKQFPVKKLWVKEEFVTPPQSVSNRIREESELIGAVYDIHSPEWRIDGNFVLPVKGQMFFNFGEKRIYNNKPRSQHSGIDISSPTGTPVMASNAGRVVLANHLYFSGKTVIIDHGLGVFSLYCHFSNISVEGGDEVEKGEMIGKIGATGRVTGPHLHWSIKIRGSRIDPNSLLSLNFK
ncbi:MAG: peptidoglycan DD-metalloendopeptidase family protein [Candidatus Aminicenantes bacterium]|nr:peptidoglycan DD-metalloendopeptidase family protein [Candidatus Aminicenantes bacterium]